MKTQYNIKTIISSLPNFYRSLNTIKSVSLILLIGVVVLSCESDDGESERIAELEAIIAQINVEQASIMQNLETFDELDFEIFTNQEWSRLHESHDEDIIVNWPDGRVVVGIEQHIEDLEFLFLFAPDTRILEHPIRIGQGNTTAVMGFMEGTFTEPMPLPNGEFIQPTGQSFRLPMATIGIWEDGVMIEEFLFWDNQYYNNQLGI